MTESLELLADQDFSRVLCVVAHPDDMEYGMSAAVAKWTAAGVEVAYLLLTSGEAGMQDPPEEVGPLRAAEQQAACDVVGVSDLTILDHPDGALLYGLDLRRDIARRIRQFQPDVVVTMCWDVEAGWGLNQADHRAAGLATVDAIRDADNTWVFHDDLVKTEDLPKWATTWLLVGGHPQPTHVVDVSGEPLAKGIASLQEHRAYLEALPGHPAPEDFIPQVTGEVGASLGLEHAVAFRVYRMGGPSAEN